MLVDDLRKRLEGKCLARIAQELDVTANTLRRFVGGKSLKIETFEQLIKFFEGYDKMTYAEKMKYWHISALSRALSVDHAYLTRINTGKAFTKKMDDKLSKFFETN